MYTHISFQKQFINISCDGETFEVNKLVLMIRSSVFADMLTFAQDGNDIEIKVEKRT